MLGEIWIRVLDQEFGLEHDKFEMLIRHPSRHVKEAVGGKRVKFRRQPEFKDIYFAYRLHLELWG